MINEITICKYTRKPDRIVKVTKNVKTKENSDISKALADMVVLKDNSIVFEQMTGIGYSI